MWQSGRAKLTLRLQLRDVRFGFANRPDFLGPVSMAVVGGACWAVVGPNGAGKSTLLRLMAGLHEPGGGDVRLLDRSLSSWTVRDRARKMALVTQRVASDLDLTARELVLMGRYPHRSFGLFETSVDRAVVERAMAVTETDAFADRKMATLSGGEAQRVHIAAALAQEPSVLLLDEPTASLDMKHQLGIFELLRDRAEQDGLAIVVVTHDVNLAGRYCSDVLVLRDGRVAATGKPGDVLTPGTLAKVFEVDMVSVTDDRATTRWLAPIGRGGGA